VRENEIEVFEFGKISGGSNLRDFKHFLDLAVGDDGVGLVKKGKDNFLTFVEFPKRGRGVLE